MVYWQEASYSTGILSISANDNKAEALLLEQPSCARIYTHCILYVDSSFPTLFRIQTLSLLQILIPPQFYLFMSNVTLAFKFFSKEISRKVIKY